MKERCKVLSGKNPQTAVDKSFVHLLKRPILVYWTKIDTHWLIIDSIVIHLPFSTDVNNNFQEKQLFLYKLVIKIPPDYASIRTISSLPGLLVFCIQRCCRIRRV